MSLYFALLPSDLAIELIQYLDVLSLVDINYALKQYPTIYRRLFPIDKLEIMYKRDIASELPEIDASNVEDIISTYLSVFIVNKLLYVVPIELLEKGQLYELTQYINKKLDLIINRSNWDIALVNFLNYLKKDVKTDDRFRSFLEYAYISAIDKDNLFIVQVLDNNFDTHPNDFIGRSVDGKNYDITKYLLSLPDFQQSDDKDFIISYITQHSNYNEDLINYLHSVIGPELEDTFNKYLLSAMLMYKRPIDEILTLLGKLRPAFIADPTILKNAMVEAIQIENLNVIKLLFNYGVQVTDLDFLEAAITTHNIDIIKFLLSHGADPTIDIGDVLLVLTEGFSYNEDHAYREIFNLLTENIDIHIDNDTIYKTLVEDSPGLLLDLLKQEPHYTDVDQELLNLIDERRKIVSKAIYLDKKTILSQVSLLDALEEYILSRMP